MPVTGLPKNPKLTNFTWSPDEQKIAMTNTSKTGVELWILDIKTRIARKLGSSYLNSSMGKSINWLKDSKRLIVKYLPNDRKEIIDQSNIIPNGPKVTENKGEKAQNRTYQDLLKNKFDEHNFEQLSTSTIYKVSIDGSVKKWMDDGMYG